MYVFLSCDSVVMNITFGATNVSVFESSGYVEVVVTKSEGAVGPVAVNFTTVDGTAGY